MVKLYTVSGHLIRELTENSGQTVWDRKNKSGDGVASGLYIYLIQDSSGNELRGKIALMR